MYGYLVEYLQLHECRPYIENLCIIVDGHVCTAVFIYLIFSPQQPFTIKYMPLPIELIFEGSYMAVALKSNLIRHKES